jgi:hypothetical protein
MCQLSHFMLICAQSFLSVMYNCSDSYGGFSQLLLKNYGNSEGALNAQKEGDTLARILTFMHKIDELFLTEQIEIFIDVD